MTLTINIKKQIIGYREETRILPHATCIVKQNAPLMYWSMGVSNPYIHVEKLAHVHAKS